MNKIAKCFTSHQNKKKHLRRMPLVLKQQNNKNLQIRGFLVPERKALESMRTNVRVTTEGFIEWCRFLTPRGKVPDSIG